MYSWKIKVFKSLDIVYFPTDLSAVKVFAYISSNYWLRFKKLRRWIQPLRCFRKSFFSAGNFACNLSLPLPRGRTAVGILEIRETKRGGGGKSCGAITRFLFPWNHYRSLPLIITSLVTMSHRVQPRRVFFLSFSLSAYRPIFHPSLSLSFRRRCLVATVMQPRLIAKHFRHNTRRWINEVRGLYFRLITKYSRYPYASTMSQLSRCFLSRVEPLLNRFKFRFEARKEKKREKKSRVSREPVD